MAPTRTHRRDGVAAVGVLTTLLTVGVATVGQSPFLAPVAVLAGVTSALAVETVFLRDSERALTRWASTRVAAVSAVAVLLVGVAAVWVAPWVLGAICWGLLTYLGLLGCVLAGIGNPLAGVVAPRSGRE